MPPVSMRSKLFHGYAASRYRGGLLAAAALYLIAWALPSVRAGVLFVEIVIRGPEATIAALGLGEGFGPGPWWGIGLSVVSALTNLVFVAALVVGWRLGAEAFESVSSPSALLARRRLDHLRWILVACAALDTWWFWAFLRDGSWRSLSSGYYFWVGSFVLLAVAIDHAPPRVRGATERPSASRGSAAAVQKMYTSADLPVGPR